MKFIRFYLFLQFFLIAMEIFGSSSFDFSGEQTGSSFLDEVGPADLGVGQANLLSGPSILDEVGPADLLSGPSMLDEVGPADLLGGPSMLDDVGTPNWSDKNNKSAKSAFKPKVNIDHAKAWKSLFREEKQQKTKSRTPTRDVKVRIQRPQTFSMANQDTFASEQPADFLQNKSSRGISTNKSIHSSSNESQINIDGGTDNLDTPRYMFPMGHILVGSAVVVGVCFLAKTYINWSSKPKEVDDKYDDEFSDDKHNFIPLNIENTVL